MISTFVVQRPSRVIRDLFFRKYISFSFQIKGFSVGRNVHNLSQFCAVISYLFEIGKIGSHNKVFIQDHIVKQSPRQKRIGTRWLLVHLLSLNIWHFWIDFSLHSFPEGLIAMSFVKCQVSRHRNNQFCALLELLYNKKLLIEKQLLSNVPRVLGHFDKISVLHYKITKIPRWISSCQ